MTREDHTPFLEDIPAYALGALEADSVRALETHLRTCEACQAELAEYRMVSETLLLATPPHRPPARLRQQLQRQLPGTAATSQPRRQWSFSWGALGAAVAVLVALNVYSIFQLRTLQLAQEQLSRQVRTGETVVSMLSYPSVQRLAINSDDLVGSVLVDKERDMVALIIWNLPDLPESETYQVWLIDPDGTRVSGGIFVAEKNQPYTTKLVFPKQSLTDFVGVGVTVEPAGGSTAPTGERMFGVDF